MNKKTIHAAVFGAATLFLSGCVASRVQNLHGYTPSAARPPLHDQHAVEEYYFLSWEPYHFICTLGILPQYHYAVYQKAPGEYEKHSTMIGWIAIPLPLVSSWKYGNIPDGPNKSLQPTRDGAGSSAIADGAFCSRVAELDRSTKK